MESFISPVRNHVIFFFYGIATAWCDVWRPAAAASYFHYMLYLNYRELPVSPGGSCVCHLLEDVIELVGLNSACWVVCDCIPFLTLTIIIIVPWFWIIGYSDRVKSSYASAVIVFILWQFYLILTLYKRNISLLRVLQYRVTPAS